MTHHFSALFNRSLSKKVGFLLLWSSKISHCDSVYGQHSKYALVKRASCTIWEYISLSFFFHWPEWNAGLSIMNTRSDTNSMTLTHIKPLQLVVITARGSWQKVPVFLLMFSSDLFFHLRWLCNSKRKFGQQDNQDVKVSVMFFHFAQPQLFF